MSRDGGWTLGTLKEHLETVLNERDRRYENRFVAQQEAVVAALAAADRAGAKAEQAAEKLFVSLNEKLEALGKMADQGGGRRQGLKDGWGFVVGAVGMLAAVVPLVILIARH